MNAFQCGSYRLTAGMADLAFNNVDLYWRLGEKTVTHNAPGFI